jgi:predicted porin
MKKTLFALATLATVAGAASAQSSVTLSGSVDLGVVRENSEYTMRPAGSSRSNVSLSGVEDLGGGLKAGFYLNHRFDPSTGNVASSAPGGGTPFWRQGWLQLMSGFGDVRIGKMLPPLQEFNGGYEPWGGGDTVANVHTGGKYAGANNARYAKAMYYRTPRFGGFQVHAMYAAGESQGATATNPERPYGFGADWVIGPFSVAAAYDSNQNDLASWGLYGKWDIGFMIAMFQYERQDETSKYFTTTTADSDKSKRWSIGAKIPMGATMFKVGYIDMPDERQNSGASGYGMKRWGLGLDYNLSKRTMLYTDVAKNSGDGWTGDWTSTMFDVGVQHKF